MPEIVTGSVIGILGWVRSLQFCGLVRGPVIVVGIIAAGIAQRGNPSRLQDLGLSGSIRWLSPGVEAIPRARGARNPCALSACTVTLTAPLISRLTSACGMSSDRPGASL